jgi:hypothetical protein
MKVLITVIGWLAWNVIIFRIEKDKFDSDGKPFPLSQYFKTNWDNWLSTVVVAALLLVLGQNVLHIINMAESTTLSWNDAYYAGSGIITEVIIYAIARYKKSKS